MGTKDITIRSNKPIVHVIINNSQINKDVEENFLCNYLYLRIFNVLMIFMYPQDRVNVHHI